MHERTGETVIPTGGYVIAQDCFVRFSAMFTNNNGFCIAYIKDSDDNIVYTIRLNSPIQTTYAQGTGVYPCRKGWKIDLGNYSNMVDYYPKFVLTY